MVIVASWQPLASENSNNDEEAMMIGTSAKSKSK